MITTIGKIVDGYKKQAMLNAQAAVSALHYANADFCRNRIPDVKEEFAIDTMAVLNGYVGDIVKTPVGIFISSVKAKLCWAIIDTWHIWKSQGRTPDISDYTWSTLVEYLIGTAWTARYKSVNIIDYFSNWGLDRIDVLPFLCLYPHFIIAQPEQILKSSIEEYLKGEYKQVFMGFTVNVIDSIRAENYLVLNGVAHEPIIGYTCYGMEFGGEIIALLAMKPINCTGLAWTGDKIASEALDYVYCNPAFVKSGAAEFVLQMTKKRYDTFVCHIDVDKPWKLFYVIPDEAILYGHEGGDVSPAATNPNHPSSAYYYL